MILGIIGFLKSMPKPKLDRETSRKEFEYEFGFKAIVLPINGEYEQMGS
ncbi:MAG: hypothetical protein ACJAU2_001489 [Maribacter sp.]|jgi:hypothetical protein